jgi:F0F1-type ATP synthase membrane subunit c/vacuolar-type H+-ATPase subunit K
MGIASNNPVSVRAIGFTTIAHQMHHQKYFKKGIYKFSKQVDQIFTLFSKDIVLAGLVEGIVIGDAFYLSNF